MKVLRVDKTASSGIAMGKAFIIQEQELVPDYHKVENKNVCEEKKCFEQAVEEVKKDLLPLAEKSDIFAAHLELLQDIALHDGTFAKIENENWNVEKALWDTVEEFSAVFESMDNEYMKERAADLLDIRNRLMRKFKKLPETDLSDIQEKVILVAKDLAPSDTAKLDLKYVQGFLTECGGVTSHVSIMAKNMGIPALVGVKNILNEVAYGDQLIMDAGEQIIYIEPDENCICENQKKMKEAQRCKEMLLEQGEKPAVTKEGREIQVCANVGGLEDIQKAIKFCSDGVGLFRSEFLYMENNHFPTEEEQFEVYKEAAILLGEKELTIRTLDIGGDKGLPYFEFPKEENPFLGYRAIRIGLDKEDVLKTQLKALLRAGQYGNIRIMYPMIISVEELKQANKLLDECKNELRRDGKAFSENIKVGIMMETPAAVMMAEELASYSDFFSIGTNDLTQYFLAVDRGNEKIASMYNSFHPGVLRAIYKIIEAAHKKGIPVGMCGEFASSLKAVEILVGMGLDEFSMSAGCIPEVKYKINQLEYEKARENAKIILRQKTIKDVEKTLNEMRD